MVDKEYITIIGKYDVYLKIYTECGEQRSDCHITYKNFGASMEYADANGELYDDDRGTIHIINNKVLLQIREWAEARGY